MNLPGKAMFLIFFPSYISHARVSLSRLASIPYSDTRTLRFMDLFIYLCLLSEQLEQELMSL